MRCDIGDRSKRVEILTELLYCMQLSHRRTLILLPSWLLLFNAGYSIPGDAQYKPNAGISGGGGESPSYLTAFLCLTSEWADNEATAKSALPDGCGLCHAGGCVCTRWKTASMAAVKDSDKVLTSGHESAAQK